MSDGVGVVEAAVEAEDPIGRVNIAVYGATGAGKSTLVNAIFGADVAPTGVGEPVTRGTALYVNDAGTLGIYDGAGMEIGQRRSPARDLQARIKRNRKDRDVSSFIHVAWYCVDGRCPLLTTATDTVVKGDYLHTSVQYARQVAPDFRYLMRASGVLR